MTDQRDSTLTALFAEKNQPLEASEFSTKVAAQTTWLKQRFYIAILTIAIAVVALAWAFAFPFQSAAIGITQILSIPLFDLSAISLEWLLAPINNIATLLVLVYKIIKTGLNRARTSNWLY